MNRILLEKNNYYNDRYNRGSFNTNFILYSFLFIVSLLIGCYIFNIKIDFIFGFNKDTLNYIISLFLYFISIIYIPIHYIFKLNLYSRVIFKIKYSKDNIEIKTLLSSKKIENFKIYWGNNLYAKNMSFLWIKGTTYLEDEEPIFVNDGENYTLHDIDKNKYYLITLVK